MKKVLAFIIAALTMFGMVGTAFAMPAPPQEIVMEGNGGNSVTIKLYNDEVNEFDTEDHLTTKFSYQYDQWQIGSNDQNLKKQKSIDGRYTVYKLTPKVHNGSGTIAFASYTYDKSVKTKWNATITRLFIMNYNIIDGKLVFGSGKRFKEEPVSVTGAISSTNVHSGLFHENDFTINSNSIRYSNGDSHTGYSATIINMAKSYGLTSAMAFNGKIVKTEKVQAPESFEEIYYRNIKTAGANDKLYIYPHNENSMSRIGMIPGRWVIGSVTNSGKIVWAKPIDYNADNGIMNPEFIVSPVAEGTAKIVIANYQFNEEASASGSNVDLIGTVHVIYIFEAKVVKSSDGKLHYKSIKLKKGYTDLCIYGQQSALTGKNVVTINLMTFLTHSQLNKILKDNGLPNKVQLREIIPHSGN